MTESKKAPYPDGIDEDLSMTDTHKIRVVDWDQNRDGRNYAIVSVKVNADGGSEALKAALRHVYHNLLKAQLVIDNEVRATKGQVKLFHLSGGTVEGEVTVFCSF